MRTSYVIAFGSNQRHPRFGAPEHVIAAAISALNGAPVSVITSAPIIKSRPLGPSQRCYANSAALISTSLPPPELLAYLHAIERAFGRRKCGQRWRARVLDLDIILWEGGIWESRELVVPHPHFRSRKFVLTPLRAIVPLWRDPIRHLSTQHLHARLDRARRRA